MAHPLEHAQSSAKKFGGKPEDYLALHRWLALMWTVQQIRIVSEVVNEP